MVLNTTVIKAFAVFFVICKMLYSFNLSRGTMKIPQPNDQKDDTQNLSNFIPL